MSGVKALQTRACDRSPRVNPPDEYGGSVMTALPLTEAPLFGGRHSQTPQPEARPCGPALDPER